MARITRARAEFSRQHIQAAALFVRTAATLEAQCRDRNPTVEERSDDISFALGAVISSAAFLEAFINEFFVDCYEFGPTRLFRGRLRKTTATHLAAVWPYVERLETLQKYQLALRLADKPALESDRQPFQDAMLLMTLRNTLVHFKPWWEPVGVASQDEMTALGKKLRSKFLPSTLAAKNSAFFPDLCLGHGCAEWAVTSAFALAGAFAQRIGPARDFGYAEERLRTR